MGKGEFSKGVGFAQKGFVSNRASLSRFIMQVNYSSYKTGSSWAL